MKPFISLERKPIPGLRPFVKLLWASHQATLHEPIPRERERMIPSAGEAERLFHALAENGTVRMPLQETFWSPRFGCVIDQFGISWTINYEKSE
jgi:hypothetical protein